MYQQLSIAVVICLSLCNFASATLSTGAGGQGVTVGNSSLIPVLDYSDTFTGTDAGGNPNRPFVAAVQPAPAYVIESNYGNPSVNLRSQSQGPGVAEFSFASDGPGLVPGSPTYPGTSGAGSATGITQTGGGVDYGIPYGLRTRYVVQVDAVASSDRIDITTGTTPGTIGVGNLSVFFRGNGTGDVSLYNGATDTTVPGLNTGLPNDGKWHNYAVLFNQDNQLLRLYVDEVWKGDINLTTFAGGLYAGFSNAAVGAGGGPGGGQNRIWTDNFQVGVPEPTSGLLLGLGAIGLVSSVRRRRKV